LNRPQKLLIVFLPIVLIAVKYITPSEVQDDAKLSKTGQVTQGVPGFDPCLEPEFT
jgi:hypothetical protein